MPFSLLAAFFLIISFPLTAMADDDPYAAASEGDYATAKKIWNRQAEEGSATAQYNLGFLYASGKGGEQSYKKAAYWYGKGAAQGDGASQYYLARLYSEGKGVVRDINKAAHWYRLAAAQGHKEAGSELGQLLLQGNGDAAKGLALLRNAAENSPKAQLTLGLIYRDGKGVEKNIDEALVWIRMAADSGLAAAQSALGDIYVSEDEGVEPDFVAAADWYEKGAEQGLPEAEYNLALLYMEGKGVEADGAVAQLWFEKAAAHGIAAALFNLGILHERDELVEQDIARAIEWYEKAAAQGIAAAETALGTIYYEGRGGMGVNRDVAYAHFKKGAAMGDEDAHHNIAVMQQKGESTGGEGQKWWTQPVVWALAHKEVAGVYLLLLMAAPFILLRRS